MIKFIKPVVYLSIYLALAMGAEYVTAETYDVTRGAMIYNQNCMRCHNPRPATEASEQEWSVIIPHMRVKAHLSLEEAMAVEAFIEMTLTADKVIDTPPEIIASGAELINQFGCRGCHKLGNEGGVIGPKLDGVMSKRGPEFIERKLREPTFNNRASAMPRFPFSDDNIKGIIDYLSTLK